MAEDARRRHGAILDFLDIGGANAARGDFNQQFVTVNAWYGDSLSAKVIWPVVNGGKHGFRNREHRVM